MAKVMFGLFCNLLLLALTSSYRIPVEVVYNGEGCECSRNIPYEVRFPVTPTERPSCQRSHGYRVDAPPQERRYALAFDFEVEQPNPPKEPQSCPLTNLIARVDRVEVPRPDCREANPPTPRRSCGHKSKCSCSTCADRPNRKSTCSSCNSDGYQKRRPSCSCGVCSECLASQGQTSGISRPQWTPYRYIITDGSLDNVASASSTVKNRMKRDLEGKRMKSKNSWFKTIAALSSRVSAKETNHKIKRDIKAEVEMLPRSAAKKLDLTLPDIIQYMPEALSSDFERGKCVLCNQAKQEEKALKRQVSEGATETPPSGPQLGFEGYGFYDTQGLYAQQIAHTLNYGSAPLAEAYSPVQFSYGTAPVAYAPQYGTGPTAYTSQQDYGTAPIAESYSNEGGGDTVGAPRAHNSYSDGESGIVGAPSPPHHHLHSSQFNDPMDHVIREIIYKYPEFVEASNHGSPELTPSVDIQREEAVQFLFKLIRGRLDQWMGGSSMPSQAHLHTRYNRELGDLMDDSPRP